MTGSHTTTPKGVADAYLIKLTEVIGSDAAIAGPRADQVEKLAEYRESEMNATRCDLAKIE